MAIAFINGESANSTTVVLPNAAVAGDLAIVCAGRTNTGGPSIPADWTDLGVISGGSGGTAHGNRAGWKLLTDADITAGNVGTWTNATEIIVGVWRGAGRVNANSGTGASGTTVTYPARSGLAPGSWQVAMGTHRTATDMSTDAITSYTVRSGLFVSTRCSLADTGAATSGIGQQTTTANASSGNVGRTFEITESELPLLANQRGSTAIAVP